MTKSFSKIATVTGYVGFEPSNLKVELARDIIIPNIYVKLYMYLTPLINDGKVFLKLEQEPEGSQIPLADTIS